MMVQIHEMEVYLSSAERSSKELDIDSNVELAELLDGNNTSEV